ncbi:phosphatidylinositol 4-kinase [Chaetomidium leptoderma]|uniref:1-phosphatidylinositol 4-kinase n=1 Tax=Chaetomidium leptoderma TaxID=669021 RepID=A0AAN6VP52_9PEZI|nr:phosphatidylinositol 4-kinase [Chaetomidium leptoderma]
MQEPEIFEQPVASREPDAHAAGDEHGTYVGTVYSLVGRGVGSTAVEDDESGDYHEFVYPEDRKLGTWSTAFLIINRVVGSGIYSTPSGIVQSLNSVGVTLIFWVIGGLMTFCGARLFVYLEYGTALPRSGGEKVYLERVYRRPRYLATCIFAVQFVLFAISTGNSINFSNYVLHAATGRPQDGSWLNRGISIAAITVVCLIHAFAPRWGIWLSNGFGAFKLVLLSLLVCTGFAALAGNTAAPRPDPSNFSSFHGPEPANATKFFGTDSDNLAGLQGPNWSGESVSVGAAGGYALALLQVLYSYSGWENANYVLTEVRDAPKTLRKAAPLAISAVTVLYLLANISYFAAMSKDEIAGSTTVVAAQFFENVWGRSSFVTRVVPLFIGLSALGNVFAQSFAMPRVKQELAKEGVLPFSRLWASDWPFNAPSGAIFLHWIFTSALILGSDTSDVYIFVTNVFIYSGNWIKVFLAVGLVYLNFAPSERWSEQRTTFRSSPLLTIFWIISLLFVQAAPFIPNHFLKKVPFYVVPTLGTSLLAIGTVYWLVWAKVLPAFGYHIQHEIVQMPDGSERVKFKRFLESDVFNQNPFLSVSYLSRYADHIGIHYVLCSKLRQFPYEDIEFFLPQLCHLIISVDNESMALEEFLLDLCEESVTAALLTFWLFQTYLHDLSSNPQAEAFKTCRRVYNKVQHVVFGLPESVRHEKIAENVLPVTVLGSFVLASIACPFLPQWAGPLAVAQARKPRPVVETISDPAAAAAAAAAVAVAANNNVPARAHTVTAGSTRSKRAKDGRAASAQEGKSHTSSHKSPAKGKSKTSRPPSRSKKGPESAPREHEDAELPTRLEDLVLEARLSSASLPLPNSRPLLVTRPTTPVSAGLQLSEPMSRRHSHHVKTLLNQAEMTNLQKTRLLRQNYFRCQTAFLTALEDISNRLVVVPKPARLSALRAELALIARDLPAEVDIPVLCPPDLVDGSPSKSRHHRIVRLNPAEATVLNSAEKVPYLLMVEILRDDFTFDPDTQDNQRLLTTLLAEQGTRKRIFDLSESPQIPTSSRTPPELVVDSVFEPASGDLGSSPLIKAADDDLFSPTRTQSTHSLRLSGADTPTPAASDKTTPRSSGTEFESFSPSLRRRTTLSNPRTNSVDQPDFSALATHMRTASQMLAQLDATSGKRPRQEVAAIRSRIIASMQSLEEQSFDVDDGQGPTFDMIMARAQAAAAAASAGAADASGAEAGDDATTVEPNLNANAGIDRMENDIKTGGLQRKGDRDDPSAAVFGEAWETKKERIRKSSPYGWMKNWDLVSVIIKTGSDLRQEAFACQLIRVCHKIWVDAGVPVWVKLMRILVTGESSGLIETIANGVSLHSIRRSLTLATIEAGQNPRRRIATLKDHFVKAFGIPEGEAYRAGVDAFKRSLAAYSVISYVLQLKDRHNGNVLIDNEGHIIHIDFGFMLSNSPGSVGFEAAPFKLTYEYVDVLGGVGSPDFEDYKRLCKQAFQALRRSADNIIDMVAMMGRESKMPCFGAGVTQVTTALRQRFQLQLSADEAEQFVETDLIAKSLGSYYTRLYDTFQYRTQGIY